MLKIVRRARVIFNVEFKKSVRESKSKKKKKIFFLPNSIIYRVRGPNYIYTKSVKYYSFQSMANNFSDT